MAEVKEAKAPEAPKKWTHPPVNVGEIVLWWPQGERNAKPTPAIVVELDSAGVLYMMVIKKNSPGLESRGGVRHIDDPFHIACPDVRYQAGAWTKRS